MVKELRPTEDSALKKQKAKNKTKTDKQTWADELNDKSIISIENVIAEKLKFKSTLVCRSGSYCMIRLFADVPMKRKSPI